MNQRAWVIFIIGLSLSLFGFVAWYQWQSYVSRSNPQSVITPANFSTDDPIFVGAGDIAACDSQGDEATAALVAEIEGTVFTLGDNVYPNGTLEEFQNCYEPSWGQFKDRTLPVPGNHDYSTPDASGYFTYFGKAAGDPEQGYYRERLGDWTIYVLNSNCGEVGGCGLESPQQAWLDTELRIRPTRCSVAMMHHPRFSSGLHGDSEFMQPLWATLVRGGVDLVLAGHDHSYERFAPLNSDGQVVAASVGTRQFVVGTGGRSHYAFRRIAPGSEFRNSQVDGVLKLALHPTAYSWEFLSTDQAVIDSGSTPCRE